MAYRFEAGNAQNALFQPLQAVRAEHEAVGQTRHPHGHDDPRRLALHLLGRPAGSVADRLDEEAVARERGRVVENRWIGQRIDDPPVNIPGLARDLGVESEDTVTSTGDLAAALERGLRAAEDGKPYLIDVLIDSTRGASFDWLAEA